MTTRTISRTAAPLLAFAATLHGAEVAPQAPESDVWLVPYATGPDGSLEFGDPVNVTQRPGYDNQPHFTRDGRSFWYTIYDGHTMQSDIWRYDIGPETVAQIVASNPESEYSATPLPDGSGISVVRVEADSTQRLWRFDMRGYGGEVLLPGVAPVGYHVWVDESTVALFVLGSPPTLQVADLAEGTSRVVASNIGRSLQRIPGSGLVSFVQVADDGSRAVSTLDPVDGAVKHLAPTLEGGGDDHAWTPDGRLLQGRGGELHVWDEGVRGWTQVADFGTGGPRNITRIAVSPMGDAIAVVDVLTMPGSGLADESDEGAEDPDEGVPTLRAEPPAVELRAGESAPISVRAVDARGNEVEGMAVRIVAPRAAGTVEDGMIHATAPGNWVIVASAVPPAPGVNPEATPMPEPVRIPLTVLRSRARSITLSTPFAPYVGTEVRLGATVELEDGSMHPEAELAWRSSNEAVAEVDAFGTVTAVTPGTAEIGAELDGVQGALSVEVQAFPGVELTLEGAPEEVIRTGDVVHFAATVRDAQGDEVEDARVALTHSYRAPERLPGASAAAQMRGSSFVADLPGIHTVRAQAGPLTASASFRVAERDVVEELAVVGRVGESRYRTTDIWVFEGVDGRDYAITGSKLSGGYAFFHDVTDPAGMVKYDSILVDARTVNDVKASPDGRYAVLSREGATNRRDGLVIIDMAQPQEPRIAAFYDEGITGGVHNIFATDRYLYALAGGDKYVIIDMADIYEPRYVSEYNHPDSRLHDVWVHDGLAYSSEWQTGVVVVDVGNGRWGGSPENPVPVTTFPTPSGATHAAFPYFQESTGKTYLFLGDEIMSRQGLAWAGYPRSMGSYSQRYDPESGSGGIPLATRGYIQIVDFTDPENPEMVARYEVPEFGTHNMWVEDDRLYQAYYEGGVRVVDVSGELMGNLYTQGREIAVFKSASPAGYTANSTMVWGTMPHKGHLFFSDTNSGLWSVRLVPKRRPVS